MLSLMMIQDMLTDLGCEQVSTAATVAQALALLDRQGFDVAMLDLNLNGANSYPLADALVARGVPFFFSTGYSDRSVREGYKHHPVLRKPIAFEDLGEILARVLTKDLSR